MLEFAVIICRHSHSISRSLIAAALVAMSFPSPATNPPATQLTQYGYDNQGNLRSKWAVAEIIRRLIKISTTAPFTPERKTLDDLVASIKDGRLFRQGLRLAASKRRGIILLEGTSADVASRGMSREAIQGALISISVIMGIPLLRSRNVEESARLMIYTARQVNATVSGAIARKGLRPKGKCRSQFEILQALPGIGPARAKRLLDNFGTVEAVMCAEADELALLPGIGMTTANAIRWVLNEPQKSYCTNSSAA